MKERKNFKSLPVGPRLTKIDWTVVMVGWLFELCRLCCWGERIARYNRDMIDWKAEVEEEWAAILKQAPESTKQ